MSGKKILGLSLAMGLCLSAQVKTAQSADKPPLSSNDQFLKQIEQNRNKFQGTMFKENQGKIANTGGFQKQLKDFQLQLNKKQQSSVLNSNSLSSDLNSIRSEFQKKMFLANQKEIMKANSLQKRITSYQKEINKTTQGDITKSNQAGLSGSLGTTLNSFQSDMFKDNMKKFQKNMFSSGATPIEINTKKK